MENNKGDLANTKIRVTPEQSAKVQEKLFELGFVWFNTKKKEPDPNRRYLLLYAPDKDFNYYHITWAIESDFEEINFREIHYSDLFPDTVDNKEITPAKTAEEISKSMAVNAAFQVQRYEDLQNRIEYLAMANQTHVIVALFRLAMESYKNQHGPSDPITPEALKKEGFTHPTFSNGWFQKDKIRVHEQDYSVMVGHEDFKGVTTIQDLKQLVRLIG